MAVRIPFTEEELYRAHRLICTEEAARELSETPDALTAGEAIGWGLPEDTLALLSLVSEELYERVLNLGYRADPPARTRLEERRDLIRVLIDKNGRADADSIDK